MEPLDPSDPWGRQEDEVPPDHFLVKKDQVGNLDLLFFSFLFATSLLLVCLVSLLCVTHPTCGVGWVVVLTGLSSRRRTQEVKKGTTKILESVSRCEEGYANVQVLLVLQTTCVLREFSGVNSQCSSTF